MMLEMWSFTRACLPIALLSTPVFSGPARGSQSSIHIRSPSVVSAGSVHNIHLRYDAHVLESDVRVVYGDCDIDSIDQSLLEIASLSVKRDMRPDRLVWIVPRDATGEGCLHAYADGRRLGRSESVTVSVNRKRQDFGPDADPNGLWFDGVRYLESTGMAPTEAEEAKSKKIAIVGGGMAGLLTSLLLESVGLTNWHIIESSDRIGGRIRTKYLNNTGPDDYQYQEMGPMRFPVSVRYRDTNETLDIQDHKMVFQLADVLNRMNGNDSDLAVKFIPWIQSNPNTPASSRGVRLPNGLIPTRAQLAANESLAGPAALPSDPEGADLGTEALDDFVDMTPDRMRNISANVFKAHRDAVDRGLFQWSEAAYLKYLLELDSDTVDYVSGVGSSPMWGQWYDGVYFAATTWRTIDKGLESLPRAFMPHVEDRLTLGRKIDGLIYNNASSKVSVTWRDNPFDTVPLTEEYDYAVVAAPFSKVRLWRTPEFSSLLSRAISTLNYQQSCKIALHYETRFWESQEHPIYGGCGSTDIPGVGSICYPSYKINSTGPGVILASYASGVFARSVAALSDEDHVALIQRAMIEAHGQVAQDQFTGAYDRQCWELDEHQAGAWASPTVGQQELYTPAYHRTEFNTIFIGEHTSITHAWIFSALDSAVRGTTQLLLTLGLVDEAKEIVDTWMARWITI